MGTWTRWLQPLDQGFLPDSHSRIVAAFRGIMSHSAAQIRRADAEVGKKFFRARLIDDDWTVTRILPEEVHGLESLASIAHQRAINQTLLGPGGA